VTFERVAIVAVVAVVLVLGVIAARAISARRFTKLAQTGPDWAALGVEPDGRRTVIAFSTPSCAACHQAQAPAIDRVRQTLGPDAFRVIKVDAARQPEVARAFGVLTVPSTVVINTHGNQVVALNQGFASTSQLAEQLSKAS
jgi:thiol-disulfide isomerase/thioredoxin